MEEQMTTAIGIKIGLGDTADGPKATERERERKES